MPAGSGRMRAVTGHSRRCAPRVRRSPRSAARERRPSRSRVDSLHRAVPLTDRRVQSQLLLREPAEAARGNHAPSGIDREGVPAVGESKRVRHGWRVPVLLRGGLGEHLGDRVVAPAHGQEQLSRKASCPCKSEARCAARPENDRRMVNRAVLVLIPCKITHRSWKSTSPSYAAPGNMRRPRRSDDDGPWFSGTCGLIVSA
jgi:hypothetical protein